jgi:phospholipid-transporting ATPase
MADKIVNNREYTVVRDEELISSRSRDLRVADVVLLENGETAPADLVILAIGSKKNLLYSDDSNVLGQSGLNVKHAVKES